MKHRKATARKSRDMQFPDKAKLQELVPPQSPMGDILNPMAAPQPGDPSTQLFANKDNPP